jgi:Flp pilus assembly protein TadG
LRLSLDGSTPKAPEDLPVNRTRKRIHLARRGAAAVEFGLILPVLLAILLGILDWGWVFFNQLTINNAAREGARRGAVQNDSSTASSTAQSTASSYITGSGLSGATVTVTGPSDASPVVTVNVAMNPFTPLVGFVPTPANLNSNASMHWEVGGP